MLFSHLNAQRSSKAIWLETFVMKTSMSIGRSQRKKSNVHMSVDFHWSNLQEIDWEPVPEEKHLGMSPRREAHTIRSNGLRNWLGKQRTSIYICMIHALGVVGDYCLELFISDQFTGRGHEQTCWWPSKTTHLSMFPVGFVARDGGKTWSDPHSTFDWRSDWLSEVT